eukprot:639638-Pelagomonas_calceolata.AAC.1
MPLLAQASFSVGQLSLEWRCWEAAKVAMDVAALFAQAPLQGRNDSSKSTWETLFQAIEAVKLHALLQRHSAAQPKDAETQAALSRNFAISGEDSLQERTQCSCLTQALLMVQSEVAASVGAHRDGCSMKRAFQVC